MDDKKRLHSGDAEESAKKRQNIGEPIGPMTQEDVLQYQKEAIWRQMQVYKRERDLVKSDIDDVKSKYASLKTSFSTLDVWWDQLMDQLIPKTGDDASNVPPTLLFNAIGGSDFNEVLEKKNFVIRERLGPVLNGLAKSEAGAFQESLANLSSMLNRLRAENDNLLKTRDELSIKVDDITEKYLAAAKTLDRQESASINRIIEASTMTREHQNGKAEEQNVKTNGSNSIEPVSKETLEELETLKAGFDESQAIVNKQKKQLEEQDEDILRLKGEIDNLQAQLRNIPLERLRDCDVFQASRLEVDALRSQMDVLKSSLSGAEKEILHLKSEEEKRKLALKTKFEKEREELEKGKQKLDADLSRIRQARDQILGQLNEKKALEKDRYKSIDELKSLLNVREERIKALEAEVKRLGPGSGDASTIDETSVAELKKLVADLRQQNDSLAAELPGMEQAFNEAHKKATQKVFDTVETEAKLKRLIAEKAKADEKYFSAMRAKDNITNELNRVKQQLSKITESLNHTKEEERKRAVQIDSLNSMIQVEKQKRYDREDEIVSYKRKIDRLTDSLKSCDGREEKMRQDLRSRDDEYRRVAAKRRDLEVEVERLQRKVGARKLIGGNGGDSERQELLSMALCSLCKTNFKDTAIKGCGHVMCNICLQDRLAARMRKCPLCNQQISQTDLLPIVL